MSNTLKIKSAREWGLIKRRRMLEYKVQHLGCDLKRVGGGKKNAATESSRRKCV